MNKFALICACALGISGIAIGAFAAHGLKPLITQENLMTFETGVRYHMYHALFLLSISLFNFLSTKQTRLISILILLGVVFFSGSIYGLATNDLSNFDFKIIGFITPLGGLFLISGWAVLLFSAVKRS